MVCPGAQWWVPAVVRDYVPGRVFDGRAVHRKYIRQTRRQPPRNNAERPLESQALGNTALPLLGSCVSIGPVLRHGPDQNHKSEQRIFCRVKLNQAGKERMSNISFENDRGRHLRCVSRISSSVFLAWFTRWRIMYSSILKFLYRFAIVWPVFIPLKRNYCWPADCLVWCLCAVSGLRVSIWDLEVSGTGTLWCGRLTSAVVTLLSYGDLIEAVLLSHNCKRQQFGYNLELRTIFWCFIT